MSNTRFYYLKGKCKWFRPHKVSDYGKWEHVLYPDTESLEIINNLKKGTDIAEGIKNLIKKDDDGYFVRLTRPASKQMRGKVVGFSPPQVLDRDGVPLQNVNIGNGSDVTTKVEVYQYPVPAYQGGSSPKRFGTAMRWESTRVDNLVPFLPRTDFTEPEQEQIEGMDKVPTQPQF